jgi:hypothetical protein
VHAGGVSYARDLQESLDESPFEKEE